MWLDAFIISITQNFIKDPTKNDLFDKGKAYES